MDIVFLRRRTATDSIANKSDAASLIQTGTAPLGIRLLAVLIIHNVLSG